ncbi:putative transferase [Helianthus debilis subsp. tardiflorus]
MKMTRTWDSTMSLIPKGGDTIWGTLDWAPEAGHDYVASSKVNNNESQTSGQNMKQSSNSINYGRIISFG